MTFLSRVQLAFCEPFGSFERIWRFHFHVRYDTRSLPVGLRYGINRPGKRNSDCEVAVNTVHHHEMRTASGCLPNDDGSLEILQIVGELFCT